MKLLLLCWLTIGALILLAPWLIISFEEIWLFDWLPTTTEEGVDVGNYEIYGFTGRGGTDEIGTELEFGKGAFLDGGGGAILLFYFWALI